MARPGHPSQWTRELFWVIVKIKERSMSGRIWWSWQLVAVYFLGSGMSQARADDADVSFDDSTGGDPGQGQPRPCGVSLGHA